MRQLKVYMAEYASSYRANTPRVACRNERYISPVTLFLLYIN